MSSVIASLGIDCGLGVSAVMPLNMPAGVLASPGAVENSALERQVEALRQRHAQQRLDVWRACSNISRVNATIAATLRGISDAADMV
jgi:hypothetical protein